MIVVGSINSSNSNRLKELAEKCGVEAVLIDSVADINLSDLGNKTSMELRLVPLHLRVP